jgi:hypothetical protein
MYLRFIPEAFKIAHTLAVLSRCFSRISLSSSPLFLTDDIPKPLMRSDIRTTNVVLAVILRHHSLVKDLFVRHHGKTNFLNVLMTSPYAPVNQDPSHLRATHPHQKRVVVRKVHHDA